MAACERCGKTARDAWLTVRYESGREEAYCDECVAMNELYRVARTMQAAA